MKIQDLRKLLSTSDREHLEKAFVEIYKQLRKAQKEEIDPLLTGILEGKSASKVKKQKEVDFAELEQDITDFIQNAYAQNYFASNRIIPKSQRPKWRFMVKNFIKVLEKIPVESGDHPKAVKLLTDLYVLMCEACNYYLFSTDDAFRSIGWKQSDFFGLVVKKTFAAGYAREDIARLVQYAATGGLSSESLHIEQEMELIVELKTSDVKYTAIEEAKKLVEEKSGKLAALKKYDSGRYHLEREINELCSMIFLIMVELAEPEEGMKYYFKNCKEDRKEAILYQALQLADCVDDELWVKVYEYGVSKKIQPYDSLKEEYEDRKSGEDLSE